MVDVKGQRALSGELAFVHAGEYSTLSRRQFADTTTAEASPSYACTCSARNHNIHTGRQGPG